MELGEPCVFTLWTVVPFWLLCLRKASLVTACSHSTAQAQLLGTRLGTCGHPRLLPLLGFCLDPQAPCLVYPLMEGDSLEDRLLLGTVFDEPNGAAHAAARLARLAQLGFAAPPPPLTWAERLRSVLDVLEALVYLHTPAEGKAVELHCDVKPSNVLLSRTPDGELVAMLADVGLAAQLEDGRSHASLGSVCGTTGYIDPLLNDSAQASPVTDGYAVGVTLLQALTGRPVANLKVVCRKLLRLPGRPEEWEEPGLADRCAGAWPVPLQAAVARVVSGLVFAPVHSITHPIVHPTVYSTVHPLHMCCMCLMRASPRGSTRTSDCRCPTRSSNYATRWPPRQRRHPRRRRWMRRLM